ncbi:hypothetical protein JoomaDRAFT_1778 [Galbibacter orientalis DSM 19592]|uniref:Uncharacterized protein n=1 Tax=Galbibacter orientalis DSM 19592 TaxID=926559 RepID=I3C592_9FLAO|nr:hypothetical protein JoomaDRAFT_1778 [Galbibacter orientalis DSM 19592]
MKELFNICVDILKDLSGYFDISYEVINILLFVIIHPLITAILLFMVINLLRKNRRYRHPLSDKNLS